MNGVLEESQISAAEDLVNEVGKMEGVSAFVDKSTSGTQARPIVNLTVSPENWRKVAESMFSDHGIDYCSMITGIHWPESSDKNWEVIYHFLRTGVKNPPIVDGVVEPIITNSSQLKGSDVPLEIQISIPLQETRNPKVASIQDIWVGADWNEKETWDLQYQQALAYKESGSTGTLLKLLADAKGVTPSNFADSIIKNNEEYQTKVAKVLAISTKLRKDLKNCTTIAQVQTFVEKYLEVSFGKDVAEVTPMRTLFKNI